MPLNVSSPAFVHRGVIPAKYTCDGLDVSPLLRWTGTPDNTAGFAVVCLDPDAPAGIWIHMILFNIPAETTELPEGISVRTLPKGAVFGANSWGADEYGGPCPPNETHRYFFTVYALDAGPDLKTGASLEELNKAMEGHILAEGEIMGLYSRDQPPQRIRQPPQE